MKKFKVEYGCEEWQEEKEFDKKEDAEEFFDKVKDGGVILGLYPATYAIGTNKDNECFMSFSNTEEEE